MEADRLRLETQPLDRLPIRHIRQSQRLRLVVRAAEQADLAAFLFLGIGLGPPDDHVGCPKDPRAVRFQAIERTGPGKVLDLVAADLLGVDSCSKIRDIGKIPIATGSDQGLHRGLANLLHRGQCVSDRQLIVADALDGKVGSGTIDVRRQDLGAGALGFLFKSSDLVGVADRQAHARSDEHNRVVRLHPGGLIGDQGIRRSMRLIEPIIGEFCHEVKDFRRFFRRDTTPDGAIREDLSLLFHLRADLLAHGPAQQIGATQAVTAHLLGDLHDLFLVDHDSIGFPEDLLQFLVRRRPCLAVLAAIVVGNIGHRARAVQRHRGDQVLEPVRAHLAQGVAHALAFHLEHPARIAARQHFIRLGVIQRQPIQIKIDAQLLEKANRALQDRQRRQPEEVELHQPRLLDIFHRVLRHQEVRLRISVQRHQVDQWPVADHHAGGMGAGVTIQTLDLQGDLQQPAYRLVLLAHLLQPRLAIHGFLQSHGLGRVVWDQFGDLVDLAVAQAQHPADVAHRGAGLQLSEGDDLRHPVAAIFAADIVDHLIAPVLAEIDVEVRHRHALGVQEALEQQVELQRIEIGDGQCPGNHGAGARSTAGTNRNALRLRPLDEIGDDQEVAGKAHLLDDRQLIFQPLAIPRPAGLVGTGRIHAPRQPLPRHRRQGFGLRGAFTHLRAHRQQRFAGLRHNRAAPGDRDRIVAGFRQVGEQRPHLGSGFEPMVGGNPAAILLRQHPAFSDAEQRIMRLVHRRLGKIALVGGDQRHAGIVGQGDQPRLDIPLDG